jgi:tetratricopeptide (TPR) repeat protein
MTTESSTAVETIAVTEANQDRAAQLALMRFLLDAALQAQRGGTLEDLVRKRPRAARWLMRKHLGVLRGAAGEAMPHDGLPHAASVLLGWLVTQLRPDAQTSFERISDDAWLHMLGWRPMLAMASHLGLVVVPDFPKHHRRVNNEPAMENLCGLWNVDTSTLYRILDKARLSIGQLLADPRPSAARRLSLRDWTVNLLHKQAGLANVANAEDEVRRWHSRQLQWALNVNDPVSALWHCCCANDASAFIRSIMKFAPVVANDVETDALVDRVSGLALAPRDLVDLSLARAALARMRNLPEWELRAYEQARQVASTVADPLLLGLVYSAMGKFYEPRDADRAFACFQDSAEFFGDLAPTLDDVHASEGFVITFVRLAWFYLMRNDERSKALLGKAEAIRGQFRVSDEVLGLLEQAWGLYWHRAGNLEASLEHRYRALNIFERIGDRRSVLATYLNIGFDLAKRGDRGRAIELSERVLTAAASGAGVEPDMVVSAYFNLGAAHFWSGSLDEAIANYKFALDQSLRCDHRQFAFRARYNLAEAHYLKFRNDASRSDERAGDAFVAEALEFAGSETSPAAIESARKLKSELLVRNSEPEPNRLIPHEDAVHFSEMATIHRHRQILAVPSDPESHAQAHLVIARAYATIAAKEREAALVLVQRAGLQDRFSSDFAELQQTFERGLTREQQWANTWKQQASDLLDDARRASLIAHLQRDGAINKSRYAELGAVSPATASKHLAMFTERGLLVQQGKGPSTRYKLPE